VAAKWPFCSDRHEKLQWLKKGQQGCFRVPMQTQEKDRQMENKPAQNIQDSFLNTARKDKSQITIYLLSGVKLTGRIRSFDKYSVVLETNNQEQLIFKHAISTVVMAKGSVHHGEGRQHSSAEGEGSTGKSEG
jgi:host factor-I protein